MWTRFMDMHSGGRQKLDYAYIYIEAPEDEAKVIFYNRFGRNPDKVTCTCCGEDYSIHQAATLEEVTAYERGCAWSKTEKKWVDEPSTEKWAKKYIPLNEYLKSSEILFVYEKDIKPEERSGSIPEQGYVWVD